VNGVEHVGVAGVIAPEGGRAEASVILAPTPTAPAQPGERDRSPLADCVTRYLSTHGLWKTCTTWDGFAGFAEEVTWRQLGGDTFVLVERFVGLAVLLALVVVPVLGPVESTYPTYSGILFHVTQSEPRLSLPRPVAEAALSAFLKHTMKYGYKFSPT
jgi:hypothetical protein